MIGAVIVHYKDTAATAKCMESLYAAICPELKVIIIDNDKDNVGYGAACNRGARKLIQAGCNYVMFLNNDLYIKRPDFFTVLLSLFKRSGADIICPCIKSPDLKYTYTGAKINTSGGTFNKVRKTCEWVETEIIAGNCFAMTAEAFKKVQFKEDFFMYCEDVDFSIRAKNAGLKMVCAQFLWAYHADHLHNASPLARYYHTRNTPQVMSEYRGKLWMLYYWLWFVPVRIAYFALKKDLKCSSAVAAGAIAYLKGETGKNGSY